MFSQVLLSMALAAIPVKESKNDISVSAQELLSMPAANRLQVAAGIKNNPKIVEQLWQIAFDNKKDMGTRWKALTLATQMRKELAPHYLSRALQAEEWFMRNAALVAYREVLPGESLTVARKLLKDKALVIRSAAVETLPNNLSEELRDQLWEELYQDYNFRKKQSLWVRPLILQKLAASPRPQEKLLFVKTLKEDDSRLHKVSISALEKILNKKLGTELMKPDQRRALWLDWAKKNI